MELKTGQVWQTKNGIILKIAEGLIIGEEESKAFWVEILDNPHGRVTPYLVWQDTFPKRAKLLKSYGSPLWKAMNDE